MARNSSKPHDFIKYEDDEVMIAEGGSIVVSFEQKREKTIMGQFHAGQDRGTHVVFWGNNNSLPEEREALVGANNIVPQIIRTKRDIILGGGLMNYREIYEGDKRIIEEVPMPSEFEDFVERNEEDYGGLELLCNDLLLHGQYYVEMNPNARKEIVNLKPHRARYVRAQKQNKQGVIPYYWLHGAWGQVNSTQKLDEVKNLKKVAAYHRGDLKPRMIYQGADKLFGGPYYYDPHYAGSTTWIKVANTIPTFHLGNLENGFNIRYLIKVPEDYFVRSLSEENRKDTENIRQHISRAKKQFKSKLNEFLAGAKNAGRGLIVTKHFYKHLQKEWPELEIVPLEVDLKDEAMLKLFDSSNQANTSAHGIPPVLAGLATGAKMTSGSEIRNLYNFWQISATTMPRKQLLKPYQIAWRSMDLPRDIKLGFRNMELTTTDKNPTGKQESIPAQQETEE